MNSSYQQMTPASSSPGGFGGTYESLYNAVGGAYKGVLDSSLAAQQQKYKAAQGAMQSDMVNHGMSGTTAMPSLRAGLANQAAMDEAAIRSSIAKEQLGFQTSIGLQQLGNQNQLQMQNHQLGVQQAMGYAQMQNQNQQNAMNRPQQGLGYVIPGSETSFGPNANSGQNWINSRQGQFVGGGQAW
jgi:hypothetical protein